MGESIAVSKTANYNYFFAEIDTTTPNWLVVREWIEIENHMAAINLDIAEVLKVVKDLNVQMLNFTAKGKCQNVVPSFKYLVV